jgi:hypothetical protein
LKILVLEGLNWGPGIHGVEFWPKSLTIGVDAGLIGVHPLSTFLLTVSLSSTETAIFVVSVGIVSRVGRSPLLIVSEVVVLLLRPWSLTLLLLGSAPLALWSELLLARLCHCFHSVVLFIWLLDWIDPGGRLGFLFGP